MNWTVRLSLTLLSCMPLCQAGAPISSVPSPPQLAARGAILIDAATGQVLAEQNADAHLEPASLTKLMTAYLVFGALRDRRLTLSEPITISEHAWRAEGSRTFVEVGKQIPAEVLIKGMIVQSGNDATIALAERLGGSESVFVEMMNREAQRLGLTQTHFHDASGLPAADHYTSARDMAALARALIGDFPQFYPWFSLREFVWNNIHQENRNGLLEKDSTVDGLKTGHTDSAGYCLVSSAKRQNSRLIAAVLGTSSTKEREAASAAWLNYGFTFYETVPLKAKGTTVLRPRVYKGSADDVAVGPGADVSVTVPRGQSQNLETRASVRTPLIAPLDPAQPVGTLTVALNGKTVQQAPLYPLTAVARGGWWSRLSGTVSLWWH